MYRTALFVSLETVAFTPLIQARCKLKQMMLKNLQNAPLKFVQFLGHSVSCLGFISKYCKSDRRNCLYLWILCFSRRLSLCDLFFCSFLMVWGSCSSWLCLLWCGSSEIQFPFFLSVRQLCCLQVGYFVPLWTKISFATFSNSSKLKRAKVNIFFLLFNCIYFTLSATLPAALLVFPELMNLFTFHPLLAAEGFVPV